MTDDASSRLRSAVRGASLGAGTGLAVGAALWVPLGWPVHTLRTLFAPEASVGWQDLALVAVVLLVLLIARIQIAKGLGRVAQIDRLPTWSREVVLIAAVVVPMTLLWAGIHYDSPWQRGLVPHILFMGLVGVLAGSTPALSDWSQRKAPKRWGKRGTFRRILAIAFWSILVAVALHFGVEQPALEAQILVLFGITLGTLVMAAKPRDEPKQTTGPGGTVWALIIPFALLAVGPGTALHDHDDSAAIQAALAAGGDALTGAGMFSVPLDDEGAHGADGVEVEGAAPFHFSGYLGGSEETLAAVVGARASEPSLAGGPGGWMSTIAEDDDQDCPLPNVPVEQWMGVPAVRGTQTCGGDDAWWPNVAWTFVEVEGHDLAVFAFAATEAGMGMATSLSDDMAAAVLGALAACGIGDFRPLDTCPSTGKPAWAGGHGLGDLGDFLNDPGAWIQDQAADAAAGVAAATAAAPASGIGAVGAAAATITPEIPRAPTPSGQSTPPTRSAQPPPAANEPRGPRIRKPPMQGDPTVRPPPGPFDGPTTAPQAGAPVVAPPGPAAGPAATEPSAPPPAEAPPSKPVKPPMGHDPTLQADGGTFDAGEPAHSGSEAATALGACASCGTPLPAQANFCGACGTAR